MSNSNLNIKAFAKAKAKANANNTGSQRQSNLINWIFGAIGLLFFAIVLIVLFGKSKKKKLDDSCTIKNPDVNGIYKLNSKLQCILDSCKTGYVLKGNKCEVDKDGSNPSPITPSPIAPSPIAPSPIAPSPITPSPGETSSSGYSAPSTPSPVVPEPVNCSLADNDSCEMGQVPGCRWDLGWDECVSV